MNKENKTIIKALNMYGRVPEQWELLEEIERLNNIIKELEEYLIKKQNSFNVCNASDIIYKLKELKENNNEY